ncbi:MAG: hypothetical protein ABFQ65_00560 [Nanoarchaeota archaeon]
MSSDKKICVKMIIEVAGRPPEYLTKTLNEIIEKINEEKGVNVEDKKVNEPVVMKDQKDFYTSFAEVEIKIENMSILTVLILKYMPAHIEIIEPELIAVANNDWNDILNEFARRLHHYDEVARVMQTEKVILENKLKALLPKEEKKE